MVYHLALIVLALSACSSGVGPGQSQELPDGSPGVSDGPTTDLAPAGQPDAFPVIPGQDLANRPDLAGPAPLPDLAPVCSNTCGAEGAVTGCCNGGTYCWAHECWATVGQYCNWPAIGCFPYPNSVCSNHVCFTP